MQTGHPRSVRVLHAHVSHARPPEARAARSRRRSAYSRLAGIEPIPHRSPPALGGVELAMSRLEIIELMAQRVASCDSGVPARA